MSLNLASPLSSVKGVGEATLKNLKKLNLKTVEDILKYFPRRYEDYSKIVKISNLKPSQVSIESIIKQIKGRYVRGGLHVTEAVASDESGSLRLVWFNQPYLATSIKQNEIYYISGCFEFKKNRLAITNPSIELKSNFSINTARILPIYKETKGFGSRQIRKIIKEILNSNMVIPEILPKSILKEQYLVSYEKSLNLIHFPGKSSDIDLAKKRLGFNELFVLILASQFAKKELSKTNGIIIKFDAVSAKKFVKNLSFKLTQSQRIAVWQIYKDMADGRVMNRLLEGDVGSGKTVVSVMAALMVLKNGYQVALMAPTELLARQHAKTVTKLLQKSGFKDDIILLTSKQKSLEKNKIKQELKASKPKFIIGTQALIQDSVSIDNLALVIVDEQHRFGVNQRQKLLKNHRLPHMLSMTATPIPRSLALTVYGELDISLLIEKPQNRKPIITELIKPIDRLKLNESIKVKLKSKHQMFVVCPVIEENNALDLKSVNKTYHEIVKEFKNFKVGLMHGKQSNEENQKTMEQFLSTELDILVATTMIEVGVDVPNANIIMIESPERFGLAQLHQLRGRVGRSSSQGYCYLMLNDSSYPNQRLNAIKETNDGFKLAEYDLKIRGAGALYGKLQHGKLDLQMASFTDTELIASARMSALEFMNNPINLIKYPYINQRIKELQSIVHLN